ncbi:hypothetical protein QWJ07_26525 [Frankia sp. RB7]|nr:hypothetical protein [Frankia sp. RB7]
MLKPFARHGWSRSVKDGRWSAHGITYQAFNQARPQADAWYEQLFLAAFATFILCILILALCDVSGGTKPRAPHRTAKPAEANLPSPQKPEPVVTPPEIGSAQPYLAMQAIADQQRKLLYINLWGEVGARDGQRFRELVTPYIRSGYLLSRVTISSPGGIGEAAMDIGEQIRTLRSEVRVPFRDRKGEPHCVFKQATQDKVRPEGEGLADPDGFACLCASACSFIWASGFRRDGDVIGMHMFRFVDDGGPQWSERELRRQTALGLRKFDGFLARMGMPAPIRAQAWATPPESMYDLTPSEITTMTRETAFARAREASCRSGADPFPKWEPLTPSNDAARSPCDQRMLLALMRLGAARYLGRLDS